MGAEVRPGAAKSLPRDEPPAVHVGPTDEQVASAVEARRRAAARHDEEMRLAAEQGDEGAASVLKTLREWRKHSPIPSDAELNAMSDKHEAAWAGVPASKYATPLPTALLAFVRRVRVTPRPRARESSARRTRDRSPPADRPRPADDDDEADLDRTEAAA
jgi:hypothetical protein